jgi:hypothetical protein
MTLNVLGVHGLCDANHRCHHQRVDSDVADADYTSDKKFNQHRL